MHNCHKDLFKIQERDGFLIPLLEDKTIHINLLVYQEEGGLNERKIRPPEKILTKRNSVRHPIKLDENHCEKEEGRCSDKTFSKKGEKHELGKLLCSWMLILMLEEIKIAVNMKFMACVI